MMSDTAEAQGTPAYTRPKSPITLAKAEREALLEDYFQHYRTIANNDPALLNQKLPREVFKELLDTLGGMLQKKTKDLAVNPGPVQEFLELNSLTPSLARLLPPDFRVFCLALNALKQWVSAEQQATDRFVLGGDARGELRAITGTCIATGRSLEDGCELHHPVRDGRPPIPLCHEAHDRIEQQGATKGGLADPNLTIISEIRRKNNNSWRNLHRGCLELTGNTVSHSTPAVGAGARAFARKASSTTGLTFQQILELMDLHDLGTDY